MKPIPALFAAIALLLSSAAGASTLAARPIRVGALDRDYVLAQPAPAVDGPRPLVLLLHGHVGTANNALGEGFAPSPLSAWRDLADREGVRVAALQGLVGGDGRTGWHDCRRDAIEDPQADDVAFAQAVIDELVAQKLADPQRVYVMGMSNGAMMALRLAQELRTPPAAIAAVSGSMAAHSDCRAPSQPVSVLLIHGTDDPIVPFAGGAVGVGHYRSGVVTGVAATRDAWLRVDGLAGTTPQRSELAASVAAAPTRARRETWGPATGPQVGVVTIDHGGHVEPSRRFHYRGWYSRLVGEQNRDFESVDEAWAFFRDKRAPAGADGNAAR